MAEQSDTAASSLAASPTVQMPEEAFDRLMPLHVRVDASGRIAGCGPTLAKLAGRNGLERIAPERGAPKRQDHPQTGQGLIGRNLFEAFEVRRPSGLVSLADLQAHAGDRLRLVLRGTPRGVALRGIAMPLGDGAGLILNLSFGIGVVDAVRNFELTDGDFAVTDLAVEMMYLVEAKTAAIETLRGFALRLQGDKQMAETQAMTDTLTGLRNRRALAQALERLTRSAIPFGLMHIDLDYFKAVNDTLGHAAGDHVLRWVSEMLSAETRSEDTVARVGGDEFVAVFPDMTSPYDLEKIARRIIDSLSSPIPFEGTQCRISASIGITTSTAYAEPEISRMQHDADEALYASKRAGRGRALLHAAAETSVPPSKPRGRRSA